MVRFDFTVMNPLGIHARIARMLVNEAEKFSSSIRLIKGERSCDMKRIFALMALEIDKGIVTITAEGEDEIEAANAIKEFFEINL